MTTRPTLTPRRGALVGAVIAVLLTPALVGAALPADAAEIDSPVDNQVASLPGAFLPPVPMIPQGTDTLDYLPADVTIDEGEPLTYVNLDVPEHDVTSQDLDEDDQPLFASETIGTGTAAVEGVETLPPGTYDFFCTVHPEMQGTLTVTDGGTS